ncbi:hypothetical protein N0V94_008173 [Neodidymelliopsis sp. IMI 364377]|nr:hypothetical protein N0V94_008173 [Neodidymelliopsis sp. IMI 364377]
MATAYYYAAHFPMVHPEPDQPPSSSPSHPTFGVQLQTPHVPTTKPIEIERADSVISAASSPRDHGMSDQLESPFFRLPAELRNQIYEDLLCAGTPRRLIDLETTPRIPTPSPTYPAILSTCKKIHEEAADLLYTTHVFHAHQSLLTSLPHLMATSHPVLYPTVLNKINRWQLTVRLDVDPRFTAAQATAAFSGAEFLELNVRQSTFEACNAAVLKLFTGVRDVKVCRVKGSVDDGLARWLEELMMSPKETEDGKTEWCECKGERYVRCCGCERRVNLEENGAGVWFEEKDAWRFGNR